MRIDPEKSFAKVDAAIAATSNPRHVKILKNFREHLAAEIAGDLERIMATQVADPQYHFWGQGVGDTGPKGQGAVRNFYTNIFTLGYNKLQYDIDRIFVTDDYLFHDGTLRIVFPGRVLEALGMPIDDPDAHYLYSYRQAAIFPYGADGRALGEDVYSDGGLTMDRIEKLAPHDVPGR
jgi:hypothetical protein